MARRQLDAIGVTRQMVRTRLANGALLEIHRGVYAVGHGHLDRRGRWLAAVLATGPSAVLSHRDAAVLHDLRPGNHRRIDVTAASRGSLRLEGVEIHRVRVLAAEEVTTVGGIPVTSVARTLVDLGGMVAVDHLARALQEAERRALLDVTAIERTLERTRGRHGRAHARVRAALAERAALGSTSVSPLEAPFARLARAAGLPRPELNVHVEGFEVDVLWRRQRLVVELDSWAFHSGRRAFQRDRTRDAELALAGYLVVRVTHDDVTRRPRATVERVRQLLAMRSQA